MNFIGAGREKVVEERRRHGAIRKGCNEELFIGAPIRVPEIVERSYGSRQRGGRVLTRAPAIAKRSRAAEGLWGLATYENRRPGPLSRLGVKARGWKRV